MPMSANNLKNPTWQGQSADFFKGKKIAISEIGFFFYMSDTIVMHS